SHGSLACSEGAGVGPPGDGGPSRAAAPARLGGFDNEPTVQPAGPPPPGVAVSKSARGRDPTGVTMADLEDYREAIFNDRLRKDPEKSWGQLVWVWNWCRREIDGGPAVVIERPSRRVTYVLPWSAFPTSFKRDVDLFLDRLSGKDLSEDGPPRPARPSTLQKRAYQLRLAASALIHRGHEADTVRSIADLLSLERYQEILRFFLD